MYNTQLHWNAVRAYGCLCGTGRAYYKACQPPPFDFEFNPRKPQDLRRQTGTIRVPVKYSHTRIKPLPLASGHGRYITVTPERTCFRWIIPVAYCIAVINL